MTKLLATLVASLFVAGTAFAAEDTTKTAAPAKTEAKAEKKEAKTEKKEAKTEKKEAKAEKKEAKPAATTEKK